MKKEFRNPLIDIAIFDNAIETTASGLETNQSDAVNALAAGTNVTIKSVNELQKIIVYSD